MLLLLLMFVSVSLTVMFESVRLPYASVCMYVCVALFLITPNVKTQITLSDKAHSESC